MSGTSSSQHKGEHMNIREPDINLLSVKKEEENDRDFGFDYQHDYSEETVCNERYEILIIHKDVKEEISCKLEKKLEAKPHDLLHVSDERICIKDEILSTEDIKNEEPIEKKAQTYLSYEDIKYNIDIEENILDCSVNIDKLSHRSKCEYNIQSSGGGSSSSRIHRAPATGEETSNTSISQEVQDMRHNASARYRKRKLIFSNNLQKVIKNYQCCYCNTKFYNKINLDTHFNIMHNKTEFECKDCNKTFANKYSYKQHINVAHKAITKYACTECRKTFYCKDNLQAHINVVHRGARIYECNECHKMFIEQRLLQSHINCVHKKVMTFQKRYECVECHKMFTSKHYVQIHIDRVHKNIRPYKCIHCHELFHASYGLEQHISRMHKNK